jgi:predicted SprT family Zn-dependent metalloprotease
MKLPSAIPVLGEVYTLRFGDVEGDAWAHCDPVNMEIVLNPKLLQNHDQLWRTLRHEIGHAMQNECGLSDFLGAAAQEMVAQAFSNTVGALFKPEFQDHLIEASDEAI